MILFLFLLITSLSFPLSLEEALRLAVERNVESIKSELDLKKVEERIREVRGSVLPTVTLSFTYTRWDKNYISSFIPENKYFANLNLNQSLFDKSVWSALKVARKSRELQNYVIEDVKAIIMGETEKLFWAVLLKREVLREKRESLRYWKSYFELVKEKYERGIIPKYEFLRARAQLRQAKADLIRAESDLKVSLNSLKSFLGLAGKVPVDGEFKKSPLSIEDPEVLLEKGNTTLKILRKTLEVRKANVELKRADYYPKLSLFFNYNFENIMDFEAGRLKEDYRHGYNFGLRFDFTLFDGSKRSARVMQERIEERKVREEIEFTLNKLKNELDSLMAQLKSAEEEIKAREDSLLAAEESLKFATERYREGVGSQVELLEARQNYEQAKLSLLSAIYNYNSVAADIKRLLGLYQSSWKASKSLEDKSSQ